MSRKRTATPALERACVAITVIAAANQATSKRTHAVLVTGVQTDVHRHSLTRFLGFLWRAGPFFGRVACSAVGKARAVSSRWFGSVHRQRPDWPRFPATYEVSELVPIEASYPAYSMGAHSAAERGTNCGRHLESI